MVSDSNRIGAEEDIDDYKGMTEDEIRELIAQREAKANAQVLEMVGDIPDADAKPPENVLFVCKLNPVTTDEDLEIIFSRFGPILSCEVIRDQKTGDSLQYAFIEFENEEDCIKAYFKMDNVLIDDRRIHVDFSQSLAKVKGISKRKYSEEDPEGQRKGSKREDGLVSKKAAKDDGYEMVFGDGDASVPSASKLGGSRREGRREEGREGRREGREERGGRTEGREKPKSKDDHRKYDRDERRRSRSRENRHAHHKRHKRDRSGSRGRGTSRRKRSRSRSRERRRGRDRSDSRGRGRSRSRSRDRKSRDKHRRK